MERFRKWRQWWDAVNEEQAAVLESWPRAHVRTAIVLASAAALFGEMVMVRWHATCFHAFAIFKNVSLLSCFLGLGIGFGLSGRRRVGLAGFLVLLALQTLLFGVLSCTNLGSRSFNPVSEQFIMGRPASEWSWLTAVEGNAFLLVIFVLNAWMFIPLGHLAGRLMAPLPRIQSYSWNLLGSLAGIGLFFALSLLWAGPEIWLGVAVLFVVPFLSGRRVAALGAGCVALMLLGLGAIAGAPGRTYYSPYQVITYRFPEPERGRTFPTLRVNHCYYQEIFDASTAAAAVNPASARAAEYYGLPYRLQERPGDVLVVGAGTGNDVAAALRNAPAPSPPSSSTRPS
jgi:hypothetical protein